MKTPEWYCQTKRLFQRLTTERVKHNKFSLYWNGNKIYGDEAKSLTSLDILNIQDGDKIIFKFEDWEDYLKRNASLNPSFVDTLSEQLNTYT